MVRDGLPDFITEDLSLTNGCYSLEATARNIFQSFLSLSLEDKDISREEKGEDERLELVPEQPVVALSKRPVESFRRKGAFFKERKKVPCQFVASGIDMKDILVSLLLDQAHGLEEPFKDCAEAEFSPIIHLQGSGSKEIS